MTEVKQSCGFHDPHRHTTAVDTRKQKSLPDHTSRYFPVVSDLGLCSALSPLMRPRALVCPELRALDLFVTRQNDRIPV